MEYEIDKWDIEENEEIFQPLNRNNKKDLKSVKEYCREHESMYSGHECKPKWKWGTGDLDFYEITLTKHEKKKTKKTKKANSK